MELTFSCACCGQIHRGVPTFAAEAPLAYYQVASRERDTRCRLGADDCIIDGSDFFVRVCVAIRREIRLPSHDVSVNITYGPVGPPNESKSPNASDEGPLTGPFLPVTNGGYGASYP